MLKTNLCHAIALKGRHFGAMTLKSPFQGYEQALAYAAIEHAAI